VTEIEHLTLKTGKESVSSTEPRVNLPKECPKCGYLKPYGKLECDNCHHKTEPPPPVREDQQAKLGQFEGKKKHKKGDDFTLAQKMLFLAELKAYCAGRAATSRAGRRRSTGQVRRLAGLVDQGRGAREGDVRRDGQLDQEPEHRVGQVEAEGGGALAQDAETATLVQEA
jgi:hypothetical protein